MITHIDSDAETQGTTGRDGYIFAKALAYAVAAIDSLPEARQESSDRDDMADLLIAMVPDTNQREWVISGARAHMGLEPFFVDRMTELTFPR